MYKVMKDLEVDSWRIVNMDPIGRANDNKQLALDRDDYIYLLNFIKEKRKQYKKEAKEGSKAAKKTNENFGNGKNVKDGKTRGSFFENKNGKTDNRTQSKSRFSHGSYAGDKGAKPARLGKKISQTKRESK